MVTQKVRVIGDKWTLHDGLGYDAYADALAEIIQSPDTETPITIGVHGAWGTGKTSLMRMIESRLSIEAQLWNTDPRLAKEILDRAKADFKKKAEPRHTIFKRLFKKSERKMKKAFTKAERDEIKEKLKAIRRNREIKTVWFNAWKYGTEEALWTALIQTILNRMEQDELIDSKTRDEIIRVAKGLLRAVAVYALRFFTHGLLTLPPKEEGEEEAMEYNQLVQTINDFEKLFNPLVKKYVRNGRLVVFIDDLDRCLPENAIEVLEAIKLFLDSEECVFVIGIHREVIERGIEVKYKDFILPQPRIEGEVIEESRIPISGESYMEKIIQLPFVLPPLREEDVKAFIEDVTLRREEFKDYTDIIAKGIEHNPRKIKRFLNAYELQRLIADKRGLFEQKKINKELLVKFSIIQFSWRDLYDDIVDYEILKSLEDLVAEKDEKKRDDVLDKSPMLRSYYNDKDLRVFLATSPLFGDEDLEPYIYTTFATQPEKREVVKIEEKIWEDLISGDSTKVDHAMSEMGELSEDQRGDYIEKLMEYSKNGNADVREKAARALSMPEEIIPTELQTQVVNKLLELSKDAASGVRFWAVGSLGKLNEVIAQASEALRTRVVNTLLDLSKDEESDVQGWTAYSLGKLNEVIAQAPEALRAQVVNTLLDLSKDEESYVQEHVAGSLGMLKDVIVRASKQLRTQVVNTLLDFSKDEDPSLRENAAFSLGELKKVIVKASEELRTQVVNTLLGLSRDEDSDVRAYAAGSLGDLNEVVAKASEALRTQVVNTLLDLPKDEDSYVRGYAARSLGELKEVIAQASEALRTRVANILLALSKDEDSEVRGYVAWSLGEFSALMPTKLKEKAVTALRSLEKGKELCWDPDVKGEATVSAVAKKALKKLKT